MKWLVLDDPKKQGDASSRSLLDMVADMMLSEHADIVVIQQPKQFIIHKSPMVNQVGEVHEGEFIPTNMRNILGVESVKNQAIYDKPVEPPTETA